MTATIMKLETVTPMFLHGENSRELELRPPPFKSLMRYWWRAVQDCQANSLRDEEAKLFGSAIGSAKGKAPFSIRISGATNLETTRYKPLPHRTDNRGFRRDAYKEGKSLDLYLITKNQSDASVYRQIAKLGFLLGGVGNRSRRGFGSIREKGWNFSDVSGLRDEVLSTLNDVAGNRFQINGQFIESKRRTWHSSGYPVIQRIHFGNKTTPNVDDLLKKIGQATHKHRHDALGYARRQERMASPIHVRIQKVGNKYVAVVTQLFSPFPPDSKPKNLQQKQQDFIDAIIA